MALILEAGGSSYYLATVWTYGRVEIGFQYLRTRPPFTDPIVRQELLRKLNEIPAVQLTSDAIEKRPSIVLTDLASEAGRSRFFQVLEWAVEQVKASVPSSSPS
ncbi:hypothetical protein EPN29_08355 [bacterium]|nr:MAG: hypothetical protein EPN29_08355 [bacterium]